MSEYLAFTICVAIKYLAVSVATVIGGYLMFHQIEGWGWIIFLAIIIAVL